MKEKKNQLSSVLLLLAVVLAALVVISFVPGMRLGSLELRRANILGDLLPYSEQPPSLGLSSSEVLDTSFLADLPSEVDSLLRAVASERVEPATALSEGNQTAEELMPSALPQPRADAPILSSDSPFVPRTAESTPIAFEDYSAGGGMMQRFFSRLANPAGRAVRIGVMGDSFTESDILTGDLRSTLQSHFGGGAVGFVGFANPLAQYRPTLKHTYEGWTSYTVMKRKDIPEQLLGDLYISGLIYVPKQGATAHFELNSSGGGSAATARLIFKSRGESRIAVTVNGGAEQLFSTKATTGVQEIVVGGPITTLDMRMVEVNDFVGYGVVFEGGGSGVAVDNYSVRSNSGLATFSTSREVNSQIDKMLHYDMIILQYGLNVMSPDVNNYDYYSSQLSKVVDYLRLSFPDAAIVIMSVSDRAQRKGGKVATMSVVPLMVEAQREAARNAGAVFWNTFEAMGGVNAMPYFVDQGWAAKDFTHINFKGGAMVAGELARSIISRQIGGPEGEGGAELLAEDHLMEGAPADSLLLTDSLAVEPALLDGANSLNLSESAVGLDPLSEDGSESSGSPEMLSSEMEQISNKAEDHPASDTLSYRGGGESASAAISPQKDADEKPSAESSLPKDAAKSSTPNTPSSKSVEESALVDLSEELPTSL